ncbi:hypothetical protein SAMN05421663_104165 [Terribacillus halophilus]|uniref:Uncharacterized protein n=1 Tax=Terribacillus halophilus TaxID=361279 RepID=A0A1G6PKB2_9BACI|nr:hypothetical protein SAMN05421663_104165 [Terribacillus halophilus]
MREITNHDLFYCYSRKLSDYIYDHSKILPLTIAINPKSNNPFSLYAKSEKLQKALDDYKLQSVTK